MDECEKICLKSGPKIYIYYGTRQKVNNDSKQISDSFKYGSIDNQGLT